MELDSGRPMAFYALEQKARARHTGRGYWKKERDKVLRMCQFSEGA
jgi:hypothetical protein